MTANDDLLDLALRHEVGTRRFARGVETRIISLLSRSDETLRTKMIGALRQVDSGRFGVRDLAQLVANVKRDVARGMTAAEEKLVDELGELAEHETTWTAKAINQASPIEFAIAAAEPRDALVFDGRTLEEWFARLDRDKSNRLAAVVRLGLAESYTSEQMARAVAEGFDISRTHARTLVRTAVTAAGSQARGALLEANADILRGVKWVSTLDGRTSAVCRARDGSIFPVKSGPRPPAHPNCRSVVVPVLKSWKELGFDDMPDNAPLSDRPFVRDTRSVKSIPKAERAGLIGQVKASETYQSWLHRQPAAFQDDVLGQVKGALFRRGGLRLDKFVDQSGREYTISELRRSAAVAFRKAGVK